MLRTVVASFGFMVLTAVPLLAAENVAPASAEANAPVAVMASTASLAATLDRSVLIEPAMKSRRGPVLPSLYASLGALEAYDAFGTTSALKRGGVEANPVMGGIAKNSFALYAVKGGATAASIFVAERLWKQNRRMHAIVLMAATNGLMATVAAHNASVLQSLK